MSLSFEEPMDFPAAAEYCADVLAKLMPVQVGGVININIPLLSKGRPKGVQVVPQSKTGFDESYSQRTNSEGQTEFVLAGNCHIIDGTETDTTSLEEGYITITALTPDMTDYKTTRKLMQIDW